MKKFLAYFAVVIPSCIITAICYAYNNLWLYTLHNTLWVILICLVLTYILLIILRKYYFSYIDLIIRALILPIVILTQYLIAIYNVKYPIIYFIILIAVIEAIISTIACEMEKSKILSFLVYIIYYCLVNFLLFISLGLLTHILLNY